MADDMQWRRLRALGLLIGLAYAGLAWRLVVLQVRRHEEFVCKSERMTHHSYLLEPRRGEIFDCRMTPLATTEMVKTICADPALIGTQQVAVARALSPLLGMDQAVLVAKLTPRTHKNDKGTNVPNRFVELKSRVAPELWTNIYRAMTNLSLGLIETNRSSTNRAFLHVLKTKAIFAQNDQLRVYPNGRLASHVIGYAGSEPSIVEDTAVHNLVGQEGLEAALNDQMQGVPGWRLTETDVRLREQPQWRLQEIEPRDGLNVVLTIDAVIQQMLEAVLAEGAATNNPVNITGIVLRPRTGEILAMATLPDYDPSTAGAFGPEARRNRVIADSIEPGSVFKLVVVSGALNEHTVELTDRFDCERGAFHFAGRTLHDHESFGVLSVEEIITHSSNIGAAKIGMKMGEDLLFEYIQRFGFGQLTGIDLPGEISASRYVQRSKWTKVSIAQVPMGQGISVTRLQTAMAMAAVANHGVLMRPMIIDRLEDNQHRVVSKYYPQVVRRVMDEAAVKKMVTALKTVPTKEGTAPKAAMEHYKVAGKTGTAQKVVEKRGYVHGKYISSFVGFFPADNPELCISIVLDEPRKHGYYGGQVAAPLFRKVAERAATYLGIPPDEAEEAGKVAEGGGPTNDTRFAHAGGTLARQSLKP